jgi:hypothetical protein
LRKEPEARRVKFPGASGFAVAHSHYFSPAMSQNESKRSTSGSSFPQQCKLLFVGFRNFLVIDDDEIIRCSQNENGDFMVVNYLCGFTDIFFRNSPSPSRHNLDHVPIL